MGHLLGKHLKNLGVDLDLDSLVKGLRQESEGKNSPLNENECAQEIAHLQDEKILSILENKLKNEDALSNGDQIPENEDHSLPAANSSKYR